MYFHPYAENSIYIVCLAVKMMSELGMLLTDSRELSSTKEIWGKGLNWKTPAMIWTMIEQKSCQSFLLSKAAHNKLALTN